MRHCKPIRDRSLQGPVQKTYCDRRLCLLPAACVLLSCWLVAHAVAERSDQGSLGTPAAGSQPTGQGSAGPEASRFDGQRAYDYLRLICSLGPRISGSQGMLRQQQLLEKHFKQLGAEVFYQRFQNKRHPRTGRPVPMANMVVRWQPEATDRILLCAHYDTRPLPDQDPDPHLQLHGTFLGANDGASGVALLMELGQHVAALPDRYGIDIVLFDAEEFVWDERRDQYFLGSTWFAQRYVQRDDDFRYVAGVLVDMVGDARLSVYQERHSKSWSDTRPLVDEIWGTAKRLGVREFIPKVGYLVKDDHLPLHQIGRIPVIDVIDFNYPGRANRYWHTTADVPKNCSANSLGKVGWVLQEWLTTKE